MQLEVGKIYEGKVTGITKFGAFVELDKDTTGMVHISEVANTFVSEIKDHLQEGQSVKVKVLSMGEDGKISLSIKKAQPAPPKKMGDKGGRPQGGNNNRGGQGRPQGGFRPRRDDRPPQDFSKNPPPIYDPNQKSGNADFEDMLSKFKASSDEKFSDLKKITDNKRRSPSRRK
ncbi:MAG: S1 RNA-binding domain-containing protein [Ruminococcus sp.]|uniref:S1 RNA-binding domain-containing protein n=1 Tax=Ruminococcus sp. TaxID=41978 RepID=UPI0025E6EA26|nr:S1 RNA-binding domain-containing protein [Ruminococcus sp.]MBO4865497.1 S1 RNA-binding domain-containing protein [Ruminococcus sp.]